VTIEQAEFGVQMQVDKRAHARYVLKRTAWCHCNRQDQTRTRRNRDPSRIPRRRDVPLGVTSAATSITHSSNTSRARSN